MALDLISGIGGTLEESQVKSNSNAAVIGVAKQGILNAEAEAAAAQEVTQGARGLALSVQEVNEELNRYAADLSNRVKTNTEQVNQNVAELRNDLQRKYDVYTDVVRRDIDNSFFSNPIAKVRDFFVKRDLVNDMNTLAEAANAGQSQINTEYQQAAQELRDRRQQVAATKFTVLERKQIELQTKAKQDEINAQKNATQINYAGMAIDKQQFVIPRAGSGDEEYDKLLSNPVLQTIYRASNNGSMAGWNKDFAVTAATKFDQANPREKQIWADTAMRTNINTQLTQNPGESDQEYGRRWLDSAVSHMADFGGADALGLMASTGSSTYNNLLRRADGATWQFLNSQIPEGLEPKEAEARRKEVIQQFQNMRPAEKLRFVGAQINQDVDNFARQQINTPVNFASLPILAADMNLDPNIRAYLASDEIKQAVELPAVVTGKPALDTPLDLIDKLTSIKLSTGKTITPSKAAEIVTELLSRGYMANYLQSGDMAEDLVTIQAIAPDVQMRVKANITYKNKAFNITDPQDLLALKTRAAYPTTSYTGNAALTSGVLQGGDFQRNFTPEE